MTTQQHQHRPPPPTAPRRRVADLITSAAVGALAVAVATWMVARFTSAADLAPTTAVRVEGLDRRLQRVEGQLDRVFRITGLEPDDQAEQAFTTVPDQ